ncbi:GGDEF domain-containing protein, partial [Enterobacter hormaechei]
PVVVVSRYGGEEFVVILFDFDCEESIAEKVAAGIQAGLGTAAIPNRGSKVSECVTASIGNADYSARLAGPEIIARAEAALYTGKEAGRDRWSL